MKRIVSLLLLTALLLCGCGGEKQSRDVISIWYVEGDSAAGPLLRLAEEYNTALPEGLLPVGLRGFSDEAALAAAFDSGRPDMLLCSHLKAEDMQQRDLLRNVSALSVLPAYPQYLEQRLECTGRSFFPLGHEVQLLCMEQGLLDAQELREPDGFCSALIALSGSERMPVFTADDYPALLYQWLLSLSTEFHADRALDIRSDNYKYVYNLLAVCAYEGAAVSMDYPSAELVRQGYLGCAAVSSSELSKLSTEGLELERLPVFKDSSYCLSTCTGLAVTAREGRSNRSMAFFLSYLFSEGRSVSLALEAGLAPAELLEAEPENELQELLLDISENCSFHLPAADSDYIKGRGKFAEDFGETVSSLGVY